MAEDEALVRALEEAERNAAALASGRVEPGMENGLKVSDLEKEQSGAVMPSPSSSSPFAGGDSEEEQDQEDAEDDGDNEDEDDDYDHAPRKRKSTNKPEQQQQTKSPSFVNAKSSKVSKAPKASSAKRAKPASAGDGGPATKRVKKAATGSGSGGGPVGAAAVDDEQLVMQYLESANRPYNTTAIFENLHRAVGKTKLQKLLDDLVVRAILSEAGDSSKVYWINQDKVKSDQDDAQVALEVAQIIELDTRAKHLAGQIVEMKSAVSAASHEPTALQLPQVLKEARTWVEQAQEELRRYEEQVRAISQTSSSSSSENKLDVKLLALERDFYLKVSKARRGVVLEFLGEVSSGTGEKISDVADKAGIDMTT